MKHELGERLKNYGMDRNLKRTISVKSLVNIDFTPTITTPVIFRRYQNLGELG